MVVKMPVPFFFRPSVPIINYNNMVKEPDSIYLDLRFENLMSDIYGRGGHSCGAGPISISSWKKQLLQLVRTIKTAIRKNVNGDDSHRKYMMQRCDDALIATRYSKSKSELCSNAVSITVELIFHLIGNFPHNRKSRRTHPSQVTDLSTYRTFSYTRTAKQRAKQITDYVYTKPEGKFDPTFEFLISKLKRDFSNDSDKFLEWLRTEHRQLYDQFI